MKKKKKWIGWVIALVLIAVIAAVGYSMLQNARRSMSASAYGYIKPERGQLDITIQGTGNITASKTADVFAQRMGKVQGLSVEAGQRVSAGDVLFTLYDESLQTEIERYEMEIEQQELNRTKLTGSRSAYRILAPADGIIRDLQARKGEDASALTRAYGALCYIEPVGGSTVEIPAVVGDEDGAGTIPGFVPGAGQNRIAISGAGTINRVRVKEGQRVKRGDVLFDLKATDLNAGLAGVDLAIENLEKNIQKAKDKQADNAVIAPINGVVSMLMVKEGQMVQNGLNVASLVDTNAKQVVIEVDELEIVRVVLGQKCVIQVDAIDGEQFTGEVVKIADIGKAMGGITSYDVTIRVTAPENVRIGMSCTADILIDKRENALIIPVDAIVRDGAKRLVRVQTPDIDWSDSANWPRDSEGMPQPFKLVEVKLGVQNEVEAEVLEGLTEDSVIAVQQHNSLMNLMRNFRQQGGMMGGGSGR